MNRDHDMPEDYATGWNERAEQHRCDEADLRNASEAADAHFAQQVEKAKGDHRGL